MIVVDSSVILEVLLATPAAAEIRQRIFARKETLHAPHLIDLEVAQVLRRYVASGDMSDVRGFEAIQDFLDLSITRYPHELFLTRIWELRNNITAYDAAYVALAEALMVPLLTRDSRLASTSKHNAKIELI